MSFSPFSRRIQHVQRYTQVLEVLARNGFAEISQQFGLDTLIEKGRTILGGTPRSGDERLTRPERLRTVLEQLGPTFVKLGQVLSTRADLIPTDWVEAFKTLQNNVPGVEYSVIQETLQAEFPGQLKHLFRSISKKPLAAGSMAQIHRAKLKNGTRIVLKVLRPNIREVTAIDMEILHSIAEILEKHFANLGYSPTEAVSEFAKELRRETDMLYEGRSTERLHNLFANDPDIVFPRVYWEASTRNVLALEEIRGTVFTDLAPGALDAVERRHLVENGARAVFLQCLQHGFFHADPHPGNLIALEGGRIAFIDCGMTGQIDARTARQLADLVSGVVAGDLDRVIAAAGAIADVSQEKMDERSLRADVHAIVSEFQGTPLDRLNLGQVLQDFFAALRAHKVRCPADIILLIKALTTIESVGRDVDPSFEMVPFVRPFIEDLVSKRYSLKALRSRLQRSALQYLELAEELPGEIRPFIAQLRKNKLGVQIEHRGLDRITRTMEHASRNISFALIISAMLVGSSILILAARTPELAPFTAIGIAGFVAAGILAILMVVTNRKYRGG